MRDIQNKPRGDFGKKAKVNNAGRGKNIRKPDELGRGL